MNAARRTRRFISLLFCRSSRKHGHHAAVIALTHTGGRSHQPIANGIPALTLRNVLYQDLLTTCLVEGTQVCVQIMAVLLRMRDETGLTVLLVEQNARSALGIADRGVVLNLGKVVAAEDATVLAADVGLRQHYLGF